MTATAAPNAGTAGRASSRRHLLVMLALVALAALAAGAALWPRGAPTAGIRASGTIEAVQSNVAPKVAGRLVALLVPDGTPVRKGELLARIDRLDTGLNVQQAQANVATAQAQVAAAQAAYDVQRSTYASGIANAHADVGIAGSRAGQAVTSLRTEDRTTQLALDQARAELATAQAADTHAQLTLQRARVLVAGGDAPRAQLDDATAAATTADAQVKAARDAVALAEAARANVHLRKLDVATTGYQAHQAAVALAAAQAQAASVEQRRAQVLAAEGALAQARAQLGVARNALGETTLRAPFDGYVVSHNNEVGELVQPGAAVLTVADLDHPYVDVYVSESDVTRIRSGAPADVAVDGFPGRSFRGAVTEIATQAEFTPENVQTQNQRIEYLVFRVRVALTDRTGALKPGLPADAVIRA